MKNLKLITTIVLLFLINTVNAQEDILDEKVSRLLELTGSKQQFEVVIDNMVEMQRGQFEDILGDEFYDKLKIRMKTEGYHVLLDSIAPIYKKHLTEKELDGMIKFYESDVGKSMIEKMPLITSESMMIGAAWGCLLYTSPSPRD